jgi:FixJ family two-component response regulator
LDVARRIVIVEDDADLRDLLGEIYACEGLDCVLAESVEALVAQSVRALGADLVLLDVNLGPGVPSGLDAYDWLVQHAFTGRIIFLTGHASTHPLVREASGRGALVLEKPVPAASLLELARSAADRVPPEAAP